MPQLGPSSEVRARVDLSTLFLHVLYSFVPYPHHPVLPRQVPKHLSSYLTLCYFSFHIPYLPYLRPTHQLTNPSTHPSAPNKYSKMAPPLTPFSPPLGPTLSHCLPDPVTLHMKEKAFSLTGDDFSVKTLQGLEICRCKGKVVSLSDKKSKQGFVDGFSLFCFFFFLFPRGLDGGEMGIGREREKPKIVTELTDSVRLTQSLRIPITLSSSR